MSKIKTFIQNNLRYFLAALAVLFVFLVNQIFPADIMTRESCTDGRCVVSSNNYNFHREKFNQGNDIIVNPEQIKDSNYFKQLEEPKMIMGQIFHSELKYITNISLSIDIVRQDAWRTDQNYVLELRSVSDNDGNLKISSKPLAETKFSLDDIENYRQTDGTFMFPIFTEIDPQQTYFIGINNDKVTVNKFNYLRLRGTFDNNEYKAGFVAIKHEKKAFFIAGDLYFKIYGTM